MDNHQASERTEKMIGNGPPTPDSNHAAPVEEAPPPPRSNVVQQLFFLAIVALLAIWLYRTFGMEGIWNIGKVAIGLGLMVFIHELGHFLAAKWCGVQVETFSVGFGPPLPGCSFRYGETLYKLAVIPLGGYVKMVGEGDGEENDDNPRSFKNKTVGQRMVIISAGVTMNILLACFCFIIAYMIGVRQPLAVVAAKDPGSPAWMNPDIRTGEVIEKIDGINKPTFEDLKYEVMLSRGGESLPLVLKRPGDGEVQTKILPVRGPYDNGPKIGVAPLPQLKLPNKIDAKRANIKSPAIGAAAAARVVTLPATLSPAGTRIVGIADSSGNVIKRLDKEKNPGFELARIMQSPALEQETIELLVKDGDTDKSLRLPPDGFAFDDQIIATTDPAQDLSPQRYAPFKVSKLGYDEERKRYDYFEYAKRMQQLAGKAIVIQVRRSDGEESTVSLLVPPAFYYTLPIRMEMGKVAAVRDQSPAREAGLRSGDVLEKVQLKVAGKKFVWPDDVEASQRSPMRLTYQLRQWAAQGKDARARLTVLRDGKSTDLDQVDWDYGWTYELEPSIDLPSPVSIPELGIAYRVGPEIAAVESAAAEDGLKAGDVVFAIRQWSRPKGDEGEPEWSKPTELGDDAREHPQPWWPIVFLSFQSDEKKELQVQVVRTGDKDYTLKGEVDPTWPMDERGIRFEMDWELQKAATPLAAIRMGLRRTASSIINNYLGFISMFTGRLPIAKNLQGPVSIVHLAYRVAGVDWPTFLIFLGMINISLAVVNFLPIPVLDGGHMVFLIYEKIRGRPASEQVRLYLTYAGLLFLLGVMVFVFYLDIARLLGFRK